MAALSSARKNSKQFGERPFPDLVSFPVADNVHIYPGAIVAINAGYAQPATATTGLVCVGRAEQDADNTAAGHSAGAINVLVRRGAFYFDNSASADLIAQANVGQACYLVDDHTVALTSNAGARSRAGEIVAVDSTNGVLVQMGMGRPDAPTIQTGSATLVAGTVTVSTGVRISAASKIFLQLVTPGAGTNGSQYKISSVTTGEPGAGAFTITAVSTTGGGLVNTDVSVLSFLIIG